MVQLKEGQTFSRELHVHGVEGNLIIELTTSGISFRVKGTQKQVFGTWPNLIGACETPTNVSAHLFGKPLEFLKSVASKLIAKRQAKAERL